MIRRGNSQKIKQDVQDTERSKKIEKLIESKKRQSTKILFENIDEVLVKNRFIYLPMLLDNEFEIELKEDDDLVIAHEGKYFLKSISMVDLITNFDKVNKDAYEAMKKELFKNLLPDGSYTTIRSQLDIDKRLELILFEVAPYFTMRKASASKKKITETEFLDLAREKIIIPEKYYENAKKAYNLGEAQNKLKNIEKPDVHIREGIIKTAELENLLKEVIELRILKNEKQNLKEEIKKFDDADLWRTAALLFLKDKEEFEIDNFGVFRKEGRRLAVYLRLNEFALRDFPSMKIYLFPPCRVGIFMDDYDISGPFIIENYKHPFLSRYDTPYQGICTGNNQIYRDLSKDAIISNLETGANVILFGYHTGIDHKGFISLDGRMTRSGEHHSGFSEMIIAEDDPRIISGEIVITNDPFIKGRSGKIANLGDLFNRDDDRRDRAENTPEDNDPNETDYARLMRLRELYLARRNR